ncbi:MAG: hypothetical protein ACREMK_12610, partial [Gemmatimonadota bacterium]
MRPPVVVLTGDLFFRAKIEAVAEALGSPVVFVASREEVERALEGGTGAGSRRVLIDLSHGKAEPTETIRALKSRPEPPHVVAFGPHREGEAFRAARRAGADRILARSAFVERLPELLREGG